MTNLYGLNRSRAGIARLTGSLSQFAGVRLMTLGDGAERGVRLFEFRTGSGLRFTVMVDRGMDLAEVEHKGRAIGWHSPTGFRHPAYFDPESEDGLGFTRSFSGFLATCGLDHILGAEEVPALSYNYPRRATARHGLHGRAANLPARIAGYGEAWEGERCILWAEGVVVQAALFGEVLHLHRRIEADLGGDEIRLTDRVVNAGFAVTPHMLLYHVNIGHPVIDDGSRYLAPVREVLWASHAERYRAQGVGYRRLFGPRDGFAEQVWQHDMAPDADGAVAVAVVNDRLSFGIEMVTRHDQLPCAYQWQNLQAGHYVMGIEPATHHVLGNLAARERGEMIWLGAGEARDYHLRFRVLDGAAALAEAEARIRAVQAQPDEDYPEPTGRFPALTGRPQPGAPGEPAAGA
jgi:hypothetical protein